MTIKPPNGYAVPEGTQVGETFQELCTFRLEKNGVCLTKMGDAEVDYDKESKPDYSNYVDSMTQTQNESEA